MRLTMDGAQRRTRKIPYEEQPGYSRYRRHPGPAGHLCVWEVCGAVPGTNADRRGGRTECREGGAFSKELFCELQILLVLVGTRETYIMGTHGTLRGHGDRIEHFDFLTKQTSVVEIDHDPSGHYGGDNGLIRDFLIAVARNDPSHHHSSPSESLESHLMAFAAEEARRSNRVVDLSGSPARTAGLATARQA